MKKRPFPPCADPVRSQNNLTFPGGYDCGCPTPLPIIAPMKTKTLSRRAASCLFRNVDSTLSSSALFKFRSTLLKFVQDKKIPPSAIRAPQNVDSIAGPPCLFTFCSLCSPLFTIKKNSPEKLARPKSRLSSIRTPASRIGVLGRTGASPTFVSPPSEFFQMCPLHPL